MGLLIFAVCSSDSSYVPVAEVFLWEKNIRRSPGAELVLGRSNGGVSSVGGGAVQSDQAQ